ncbi:MAG: hypothetical protein HQ521_06085 [Bacteroidetes bacterium]|nr:hypothetical protein [Bacteroidota bacterium]
MYLFIYKTGEITKTHIVTPKDKVAADTGVFEIADITLNENPLRYHDGYWYIIEKD